MGRKKHLDDLGIKKKKGKKVEKHFDRLCRGINLENFDLHTKPIFVLEDIEKMKEQMQNFGFKPGDGQKRELTTKESFQALAKERRKFVEELLLHKFAFFDFVLGIAVGSAITVLSFLFG